VVTVAEGRVGCFRSPPLATGAVGAGGALARDGIGGRFGWWTQWESWFTTRIGLLGLSGKLGSALPCTVVDVGDGWLHIHHPLGEVSTVDGVFHAALRRADRKQFTRTSLTHEEHHVLPKHVR
jgi:hypothetical protein